MSRTNGIRCFLLQWGLHMLSCNFHYIAGLTVNEEKGLLVQLFIMAVLGLIFDVGMNNISILGITSFQVKSTDIETHTFNSHFLFFTYMQLTPVMYLKEPVLIYTLTYTLSKALQKFRQITVPVLYILTMHNKSRFLQLVRLQFFSGTALTLSFLSCYFYCN